VRAIARWRSRGIPAASRRRWYRQLLSEVAHEKLYTYKVRLALTFTYIEPADDIRKLPPGKEWKPD
jgi:hypothetical protein